MLNSTNNSCDCPIRFIASLESSRGPFANTLCVLAIISNLFTIVVLRRIKKRSCTDNLLLAITVADLMLPILFLVRHVYATLGTDWSYRVYIYYLWLVFYNTSTLLTLMLAARRFIAIAYPHVYRRLRYTGNMILTIFLFCVLLFLPFCWYRPDLSKQTYCKFDPIRDMIYTVMVLEMVYKENIILDRSTRMYWQYTKFVYWLYIALQIMCPLILVGLSYKILFVCFVTTLLEALSIADIRSPSLSLSSSRSPQPQPSPPIRRSHVNITRVFAGEKPFFFKRIKPLIRAQRRLHEQGDASTLGSVYEVIDRDSVVVEANNESNFLNDIPDSSGFNFKVPSDPPKKKQQEVACVSNLSDDGVCLSKEVCHKRSGTIGNLCKQEKGSHCCSFIHTCGASSPERVSYFRSPPNTSSKSQGSLACDFDVRIQKDTCAVRVEYTNVNLARKLGGVCDVDQIYILNSVDGPTNGQCGPLSGYATTVAVKPKQDKPLKIALLVQNDVTYNWDIKLTQLSCNEIYEFKAPRPCGMTFKEPTPSESHFTPTYTRYSFSFQPPSSELDVGGSGGGGSGGKAGNGIWWSYPEPIFNMYYYSSTKKHLLKERLDQNPSKFEPAERRIVGGTDAGVYEFPWQVAIALDDLFFCGGALINENYVLTAAHCVLTRDTPIGNLKLHLGDHNLMTPNETIHVARGVRKIFFHSHFHPFLLDNDIALLQLDSPVTFVDNIQPICLPDPNEMYTNKKATVGGWGVTSYPMGTPSPMLQKIQVEVVSNFHCSRIIEETVSAGMLCAAPPALQGTCFGDSGGPLSIEADSGRHVLIGIVSYGLTGCALVPAFPDIYTRVSEYLKWIEANAL